MALPTAVLPAPIMPISATVLFRTNVIRFLLAIYR